jgi:hypothetical protein
MADLMSADEVALLAELTALAAGVAFSPFSVIPAIALVVHSSRPRPVGLAFAGGWLLGKAAITAAFAQVPRMFHHANEPAPVWTGWLRIALGVLFIAAAVLYWRRPVTESTPDWLRRIKDITPMGGATVGLALTVINLKVVLLCAAAGYAIGLRDLGGVAASLSVGYFAVLAGSSAVIPILAYSAWTTRIDRHLERFRLWMQRRQRVLTVAVLALIGVAIVASGAAAV